MPFYATFYMRLLCGCPASPIPKILSIWLGSFFRQWPFPDLSLTLGSPCWSPGIKLNRSLARLLALDKWYWAQLLFYEWEGSFLPGAQSSGLPDIYLSFCCPDLQVVALQEDDIHHWCKKKGGPLAGRSTVCRGDQNIHFSEVGQLFASR